MEESSQMQAYVQVTYADEVLRVLWNVSSSLNISTIKSQSFIAVLAMRSDYNMFGLLVPRAAALKNSFCCGMISNR